MTLFPIQGNGLFLNQLSKDGRRNVSYGRSRAFQENKGISNEHILWVWLFCKKVSSNTETWHYPLQAQNVSRASPSMPCRTLLKFAVVCDRGEWWISGYCFAFLFLSHFVCPLQQWRGRGSWQGISGSSSMWTRGKASLFFSWIKVKDHLVQEKQRTGFSRWTLSCC